MVVLFLRLLLPFWLLPWRMLGEWWRRLAGFSTLSNQRRKIGIIFLWFGKLREIRIIHLWSAKLKLSIWKKYNQEFNVIRSSEHNPTHTHSTHQTFNYHRTHLSWSPSKREIVVWLNSGPWTRARAAPTCAWVYPSFTRFVLNSLTKPSTSDHVRWSSDCENEMG